MGRLEDEAGISYEDVELDNLAEVTARVFASLRRFATKDTIATPRGPAFAGADARRHEALNRAVTAHAPNLPDAQRRALAAYWTCCGVRPPTSGWSACGTSTTPRRSTPSSG